MKYMNLNNQEAYQSPRRIKLKSSTLRHIIVELSKEKEKISKTVRGVTHHVRLIDNFNNLNTDHFSSETTEDRRHLGNI